MLAIARACKELRDLALPIIYRTVDLSVQNRPLTFDQHWWRGCPHPCTCCLLELLAVNNSPLSTHCSRIQVLELTSVPLYGQFAKIGIRQGPCQTNQRMKGLGSKLSPDTRIWEAFQHLTNVQHLGLCSSHRSCDELYLRTPPTKLFSTVTRLYLSGVMDR